MYESGSLLSIFPWRRAKLPLIWTDVEPPLPGKTSVTDMGYGDSHTVLQKTRRVHTVDSWGRAGLDFNASRIAKGWLGSSNPPAGPREPGKLETGAQGRGVNGPLRSLKAYRHGRTFWKFPPTIGRARYSPNVPTYWDVQRVPNLRETRVAPRLDPVP